MGKCKCIIYEYILFLLGIILPILVILSASEGIGREVLMVFSVFVFLIFTMGVILFRAMLYLYDHHEIVNIRYTYFSSGPILGQLERLTYTAALLANVGSFIVIWIGMKTFPLWAERKFKENPHSWAISLSGNLMNILGAAIAFILIKLGAPCVSDFMRGLMS